MIKLNTKNFLTKLNQDIFTISVITFVGLFFLELIKPKFVIAYLDLNKVLLLCLITGGVAIINQEPINEVTAKTETVGLIKLLILSLITFVFIWIFLRTLGGWGLLISLAGGVVTFLMGITLNDN